MNSKAVVSGLALVAAMAVFAEDEGPKTVTEIIHRQTGGNLVTLYKNTKSVAYVNAQTRAPAKIIDESRAKMESSLRTPIAFTNGVFDISAPKIYGELSLYVIDDEKLPMSLVCPEGRWAFVNVAPLAKGRGEKQSFFEARVRKEVARVGCMLLGGIGSTYKENLLSFVGGPEDLDKFATDVLPVDGTMRCGRYLLGIGVKPWRRVTYRKACEEGWAPQPTNDLQKAIWNQVHEIPSNPIKIKYDPKRDK